MLSGSLVFNIHVVEWTWRVLRLLVELILHRVKVRLHQASVSTLRQLCNGASGTVLIENNGVARKRVATHSGVTPLFSIRIVLLASLQNCRSIDADAWCKQALT